jgi:hypothetical protein
VFIGYWKPAVATEGHSGDFRPNCALATLPFCSIYQPGNPPDGFFFESGGNQFGYRMSL